MTQSTAGLVVTLADGVGDAELEQLAAALRLFKDVASVQRLDADVASQIALAHADADAEWRSRIVGLLDDEGV